MKALHERNLVYAYNALNGARVPHLVNKVLSPHIDVRTYRDSAYRAGGSVIKYGVTAIYELTFSSPGFIDKVKLRPIIQDIIDDDEVSYTLKYRYVCCKIAPSIEVLEDLSIKFTVVPDDFANVKVALLNDINGAVNDINKFISQLNDKMDSIQQTIDSLWKIQ